MMTLAMACCVLALTVQTPQDVAELRALVQTGPDSALVQRLRRGPRDLREVLRQFLAEAAGREDSAGVAAISAAERLANAWLMTWNDSFFVRRVRRFRSLSRDNQQLNAGADSIVRAGNIALPVGGIAAALPSWRESLRLYDSLADSAGMARALVAIAGGFRGAGERDSAVAYFKRCRELAERFRDYTTLGNVMTQQADMQQNRGDYTGATEQLTRAQSMLERAGDPLGVAAANNILGIIASRQGNNAGARIAFGQALTAYRNAGTESNVAMMLANLGVLAMRTGDYAESARLYAEALSTYRKLGRQQDVAFQLRNLGGLAMNRGDYPSALSSLTEAVEILGRTGSVNAHIDARVLLSDARSDMGDLQGALADLNKADSLARSWDRGESWMQRLALARGHLAYRFNRLTDAEREYTRAQRLPPEPGEGQILTRDRAQLGMAEVLLKRGRYREAQVAMERLLLQKDFGSHNDASARVLLGEAARRRGDVRTARLALREAIDTLRSLGSADDEADALAQLGDLEISTGRAVAAESLYQQAIARLGALPSINAWRLHAGLAVALRRRGALADAATELQTAVAQIERASGRVQLEERRSAYRADKWDVYIDLALLERERGHVEAALEMSERLRARQMLELIARGRPAASAAGETLASRELDLRRKIAELIPQAEQPGDSGARGMRDPGVTEAANAAASELARARDEYSDLLLEMREANPAYAALVSGEIAPPRVVQAALAPDEALLEYLVGDSTTIVFVVSRDTLAAFDLRLSHATVTGLVDFARSVLANPAPGLGAEHLDWRPSLRRLYRRLVAPVQASGLLAGKQRLVIAPHAELHYLPWSALVIPGAPERLLIERFVIEYVPSASVWLRLRERPAPPQEGVLALAPRAAALPGTRAEVAAIERTFSGRTRVLIDTPATERAFRELAPSQEIIHLATFGVLNKHNPMFSFVQLGADSTDDGRLEVHEVFGMNLRARLLVLSACQTGVGAGALSDVPPGDDWVGLVQGFLYAGASNVMATLWPVSDVATARLMDRFYRELAAGRPEAEALALTQRVALRDTRTAHPFFWAGFTLVRGR